MVGAMTVGAMTMELSAWKCSLQSGFEYLLVIRRKPFLSLLSLDLVTLNRARNRPLGSSVGLRRCVYFCNLTFLNLAMH